MKWLKMRACSSSGRSRWRYIPLYVNELDDPTKDWVQELVEEENDKHAWSEHHRRIEYEIINTTSVPNSMILETHKSIERKIEHAKESIEINTDRLAEIKKLIGNGSKTDPDEIEAAKRKAEFEATMKRLQEEREEKIRNDRGSGI